jgi:tRNA(Arg) A34 adenosine deaminase TadA
MESKEIYFMKLALEQATLALHPDSEDREPEVPVGCVFVLSETLEVIGKGFNSPNIEQNVKIKYFFPSIPFFVFSF